MEMSMSTDNNTEPSTEATLLLAAPVVKHILDKVEADVQRLEIQPGLTVLQVGEEAASSIYVRRKNEKAKSLGFTTQSIHLPLDISQEELLQHIQALNADPKVHGILVQLPLPKHIDEYVVLDAIDPRKDVDGFHPVNAGLLSQGRPNLVSCTPKGIMEMLRYYQIDVAGKHAVVIGRSNIVGRPMVALLEQANCTVTVCHSKTKNLPAVLATAEIVVAAVGKANMVQGSWLRTDAVVIDVGINRLANGTICGDVDFASAKTVVQAITPVPGGVGPMTIACLMQNTLDAAKKILGVE